MNALDARRFRDTIGLFATGVAVIVARAGEEVLAMTVNAVSSLSLDPMLVLFCPGKKTRSWREPAPPAFRFVPSSCAPRLEGSLAAIECEPERVVDAGDHWVVIGRVRAVHSGVRPHQPLVFFSGQYRNLDSAESVPAPDLANIRDEPAHIFYDRWSH